MAQLLALDVLDIAFLFNKMLLLRPQNGLDSQSSHMLKYLSQGQPTSSFSVKDSPDFIFNFPYSDFKSM